MFELLIPASLSAKEELRWIRDMHERYGRKVSPTAICDDDLMQRAQKLARTYLPAPVHIASIRFVRNQKTRWGSCTSAEGSIRLSHELIGMPDYVIDAVIVHELAHLIEPNHGPAFRAIEAAYPHAERAKAFLEGVTFQKGRG